MSETFWELWKSLFKCWEQMMCAKYLQKVPVNNWILSKCSQNCQALWKSATPWHLRTFWTRHFMVPSCIHLMVLLTNCGEKFQNFVLLLFNWRRHLILISYEIVKKTQDTQERGYFCRLNFISYSAQRRKFVMQKIVE